jgi:hypothetical protein
VTTIATVILAAAAIGIYFVSVIVLPIVRATHKSQEPKLATEAQATKQSNCRYCGAPVEIVQTKLPSELMSAIAWWRARANNTDLYSFERDEAARRLVELERKLRH